MVKAGGQYEFTKTRLSHNRSAVQQFRLLQKSYGTDSGIQAVAIRCGNIPGRIVGTK
jgi:hypothetical protein